MRDSKPSRPDDKYASLKRTSTTTIRGLRDFDRASWQSPTVIDWSDSLLRKSGLSVPYNIRSQKRWRRQTRENPYSRMRASRTTSQRKYMVGVLHPMTSLPLPSPFPSPPSPSISSQQLHQPLIHNSPRQFGPTSYLTPLTPDPPPPNHASRNPRTRPHLIHKQHHPQPTRMDDKTHGEENKRYLRIR